MNKILLIIGILSLTACTEPRKIHYWKLCWDGGCSQEFASEEAINHSVKDDCVYTVPSQQLFCRPKLRAILTREEDYVETPEYDMEEVWKDIVEECENKAPSCDCEKSAVLCLKDSPTAHD